MMVTMFSGKVPQLTSSNPGIYADPSQVFLTSPLGWGTNDSLPYGQAGYDKNLSIDDELTMLDLRAEREIGGDWLASIEFGVNYQTRKKVKDADEYFIGLAGNVAQLPLPSATSLTDLSFLGIPAMVTYDPLQAINSGIFELTRNPNADVIIKSWQVEEDVTIPFAMINFDTLWGNTVVSGNAGIQYVDTDQSSSAISASCSLWHSA